MLHGSESTSYEIPKIWEIAPVKMNSNEFSVQFQKGKQKLGTTKLIALGGFASNI